MKKMFWNKFKVRSAAAVLAAKRGAQRQFWHWQ